MNKIFKKYDDKGNITYYKDSTGFECWYEYDNNGRLINIK